MTRAGLILTYAGRPPPAVDPFTTPLPLRVVAGPAPREAMLEIPLRAPGVRMPGGVYCRRCARHHYAEDDGGPCGG